MLQIKLTLQCSYIPIDLLTPPPNLSQGRQTRPFPFPKQGHRWNGKAIILLQFSGPRTILLTLQCNQEAQRLK